MSKKVKLICLVLSIALLMGVAAVGCGKTEESKTEGKTEQQTTAAVEKTTSVQLEPVKLKMYMVIFDQQKGAPEVFEELNKILKNDLNATVEIEYIAFADRNTKLPLVLASGEQCDIVPNYGYFNEAAKGAYVDITDMLGSVTPALKAKYTPLEWRAVTVNGRIYAVPSSCATPNERLIAVRGDIMKKAGMKSVKTLEDIEQYLQYVKDNEKELVPFDGMLNDFRFFTENYVVAAHGFDSISKDAYGVGGYYNLKDADDTKIYSRDEIWDTIVLPFWKKLYEMQQKGLWPKGVLQNKTQAMTLMVEGKTAFAMHKIEGVNDIYKMTLKSNPEWDVQLFPYYDFKYSRALFQVNGLAIGNNSKNPERALMFIEKLMTDIKYHDLTVFGIEGKHYTVRSDGKYLPVADSGFEYRQLGSWMWDDLRSMTQLGDNHPILAEFLEQHKKIASKSPYCALPLDQTQVKNEVAAVDNVNATYGQPLLAGLVNPEKIIAEYRQKLKEAGIEKLEAAYKEQAEAYLKSLK